MAVEDTERARDLVTSIYAEWGRGDVTSFKDRLAETFELFVPSYLPWGGRFDRQQYANLLPRIASILDFAGMRYESLTAEHGHVVALIDIGVHDTGGSILISEHWDVADGKAVQLRVAYFDPRMLLEKFATADA